MKIKVHQLILITILSILPTLSADAATFSVTNVADSGTGSLRQAILDANATAGADTIDMTGISGTISLVTALPDVIDSVSFLGPGANRLAVSRDPSSESAFRIFTIGPSVTVSYAGLTISRGTGGSSGAGGIYVGTGASVELTRCRVNNNSGGAIRNSGGTVNILESTISDNNGGAGAGISNDGLTTITNSIFANNRASLFGGAILGEGRSSVDITGSTFSGNSADEGGAMYIVGAATVTNSTFSGNEGRFQAGVIYNLGSLTLLNSTITGNHASGSTGGILNLIGGWILMASNIIVGNNVKGTSQDFENRFGSIVNDDYNIIGVASDDMVQEGGSQFGFEASDVKLGPLQYNCGPTPTFALEPGSIAIDQGRTHNWNRFTTDQRGGAFVRTFDDPSITNPLNGDGTDVGAFELQPSCNETPPDTTITASPDIATKSSSATFIFESDDATARFECKLDDLPFTDCTSSLEYHALSDGSHTFHVRAVDEMNTADPSPATYTWVIDNTSPTVTINQAAGQADPAKEGPVNFTVVFSEPVTGFDDSAADIAVSGTAGATSYIVTEISPNDGTTYNVAIDGITANGTVIALIPSDIALDSAGNYNNASTSLDNTVTIIGNRVPLAVNDSYAIDEDTTLFGGSVAPVLANDSDEDNDPLTAVLIDGPANAAVFDLNPNGFFHYSPQPNFSGTDSFTYKAVDGTTESNIATVKITVNPIDDAAVISLSHAILPDVQYSDPITSVTISAVDIDTPASELVLYLGHRKNGQRETLLPGGLTLTGHGVSNGARAGAISGPALTGAGNYEILAGISRMGAGPPEDPRAHGAFSFQVTHESLAITGNNISIAASAAGGTTATGITPPLCFDMIDADDGSRGDTSLIGSSIPLSIFVPSAGQFSAAEDPVYSGGGMGVPRTVCFPVRVENVPLGSHEIKIQVGDDHYVGSGTATIEVVQITSDLLVSLGVDNTNPRQDSLVTYTITVSNFGPNDSPNTVVNDVLSSGTTFVSARANRGRFTSPRSGQTGTVTWYLDDLPNGGYESAQIEVTVIVKGKTTITNTATVSSDAVDPNPANNSAAITVSVANGGGGGGKKK